MEKTMNTIEEINHPKLTRTMERVRSGKKQLFREKDPKNRSFISKENADLILQHERKEMYAELIEGKWYWINGCEKCKGNFDKYSYVVCEKHDVCESCGISRSKYSGTAWGRLNGS